MKGWIKMGRFNLLDEKWISVISDNYGTTENVSLVELFNNSQKYKGLGGDSKTQDFAVMRLLLAVLHTVFSRFDAGGEEYGYFELNDRLSSRGKIEDEDDLDDYMNDLYETWETLWARKKFPDIIETYLENWRDRFFLLDDKYPFYQVVKSVFVNRKISKAQASSISGKNINRLISESGNKSALFSPKYESKNNKEILSFAEIARWLVTFQGYTGLSDKVIFGSDKYKASKGWIFDLGGICIEGNNLFETLLLNLVLVHPEDRYIAYPQIPSWEEDGIKIVDTLLNNGEVNNIASLYTNWSRAIYIDPEMSEKKPFTCEIVKLPEITHTDQFLEPMTLWKYNNSGKTKDTFTPRKHQVNQSIWRQFGLLTVSTDNVNISNSKDSFRRPVLMSWLNNISEFIGNYNISLQAISMRDDGNATSWVPVDEIYDSLNLNEVLLTDNQEAGWVPRINEAVNNTKQVVEVTYRRFINDIKEIRNSSSKSFTSQKLEEMYFEIDIPFRNWISSIRPEDDKDEILIEWYKILKNIASLKASSVVAEAGPRDYKGIDKDEKGVLNIATAYNKFIYYLNITLES